MWSRARKLLRLAQRPRLGLRGHRASGCVNWGKRLSLSGPQPPHLRCPLWGHGGQVRGTGEAQREVPYRKALSSPKE